MNKQKRKFKFKSVEDELDLLIRLARCVQVELFYCKGKYEDSIKYNRTKDTTKKWSRKINHFEWMFRNVERQFKEKINELPS